ncbi:MAG: hypothetical protein AAF602_07155 [Myxococcota bacterium]
MRHGLAMYGLIALIGCDPGDPISAHPCATDEMGVEVAPPDGDYGDLEAGGAFWVGIPPQGGAPYTPFRVRISGPDAMFDGVDVEVRVTEGDALVAENVVPKGLTCANVGENAGRWVGSEVHLRYYGLELAELDGRDVEVEVTIVGGETGELVATERGRVTLVVD